jgi:membrane-bound lytic murein transglycosylase MltF
MQIKPETAASEPVGINDIGNSENNINAGVKYLAYLRERYFTSPDIALEDQLNFSWAAYNAGPARINKLRDMASELSYDPNKWFSNVERIAAREIGRETVRYVANVNKYYIAYKLSENKL